MGKLDHRSAAALRNALSDAETAKAATRLMVALAYKDGVPVTTLSERYGIPASTLYYWLNRIAEEQIAEAITDEPRPGRPPALDPAQRDALAAHLGDSPREQGYEAAEWTAALLRRHIQAEFDVEYSLGHVRRLLRESDTTAGSVE